MPKTLGTQVVVKDPVENAQIKVDIPKNIYPVSYKSFSDGNTRYLYSVDNQAIIAEWEIILSDNPKQLVILYDVNENVSKLLKSEDRTYHFKAYNNKNGNRKRDYIKLNCDKTGWDYFYRFKYG